MIREILKTLRPHEWIKNLFVFAPLFFSGSMTNVAKLQLGISVFLLFCGVSGAVYCINDIADRKRDADHPTKCQRPIASGKLPVLIAVLVAIVLFTGSIGLAYLINTTTMAILLTYAAVNLGYSFGLKHVVIIDVACIATGFVLRVVAGGVATGVSTTPWIIIVTFLLASFLALAKRRQELVMLSTSSSNHRPVLTEYTPNLVDQLISVVTPITVIVYVLYALDSATVARFGTDKLYITAVFVLLGIFRYLYLVHRQNEGGSPARLVVRDAPLAITVIVWVVTFGLIIYFK